MASDWSTLNTPGSQIDMTLHIFSRRDGKAEVLLIASAIEDRLATPIVLPAPLHAHQLDAETPVDVEVVGDPDPSVRHGIVRLRLYVD